MCTLKARHVHTKKEDSYSQMRGEKLLMVSICGEKIENLRESALLIMLSIWRSDASITYTIIESNSEMEKGIP